MLNKAANDQEPVYKFFNPGLKNAGAIVTHLSPPKPDEVFSRARFSIEEAIKNDLALVLTGPGEEGQNYAHLENGEPVLATVVGYRHRKGLPWGYELDSMGTIIPIKTDFNLGEIGSLYRKGNTPGGFFKRLANETLLLKFFEMSELLRIGAVMTQCVATDKKGKEKLECLGLGWRTFGFDDTVREQFKLTLANEHEKNVTLASYHTLVGPAVLAASKDLLGMGENPTFTLARQRHDTVQTYDYFNKRNVCIDMSQTGIIPLAKALVEAHEHGLLSNGFEQETSWTEAWKAFNRALPRDPRSLDQHKMSSVRKASLETARVL